MRALLLTLMMVTAASACDLQIPPARFASGQVNVHEFRVPLSTLAALCRVSSDRVAVGCTFRVTPRERARLGTGWLVWLPRAAVGDCSLARIRAHEYAHARGWPAWHPT